MSEGFLYVATGKRCMKEVERSITSLRKVMPDAHVTLHTDVKGYKSPNFDTIIELKSVNRIIGDRLRPIIETPYDRTISLDTDTWICRDLRGMFALLDQFDLAVSHAESVAQSSGGLADYRVEAPWYFPEFNIGVFIYRKSPEVTAFLHRWVEVFEMHRRDNPSIRNVPAQPAFRQALFESRLRFYVLPAEINLRTVFPVFLASGAMPAVIHGRHPDFEWVEKVLTESHVKRVFLPSLAELRPKHFNILTPPGHALTRVLAALLRPFVKVKQPKWKKLGLEKPKGSARLTSQA